MGASLGLALRERGEARQVVGFDVDPGVTARARERGAIDVACSSVAEAVTGSNLVVLATPLLAMRDLLAEMAPLLAETTIVTDLGSVKAEVVSWAESLAARPPPVRWGTSDGGQRAIRHRGSYWRSISRLRLVSDAHR